MKTASFLGVFVAACSGLIVVGSAAEAADDFTAACVQGMSGTNDTTKLCACMATKVPDDARADATDALRRVYAERTDRSTRVKNPSPLPPNVTRGLQATAKAYAGCR